MSNLGKEDGGEKEGEKEGRWGPLLCVCLWVERIEREGVGPSVTCRICAVSKKARILVQSNHTLSLSWSEPKGGYFSPMADRKSRAPNFRRWPLTSFVARPIPRTCPGTASMCWSRQWSRELDFAWVLECLVGYDKHRYFLYEFLKLVWA